MTSTDTRKLFWIKLLHSLVWLVFAGAIVAIPVAIIAGRYQMAMWLSLLVWGEVIVLLANSRRCPLTAMAARHTSDRAADFDIFLPVWLAQHNQAIFGTLFAATQLWLGVTWVLNAKV
jgi:hypothetical protein